MTTQKLPQENKPDVVQVKNPKTGHYVKIDRSAGKIVSHKKSDGPYKGVPVASKRTISNEELAELNEGGRR